MSAKSQTLTPSSKRSGANAHASKNRSDLIDYMYAVEKLSTPHPLGGDLSQLVE